MRWLCLVAGLLVACSGSLPATTDAKKSDGPTGDAGPDPNDGARSGTRLKITYWAFADGTRAWNQFYDAQRRENCYLSGPWTDGNYYCTPTQTSSIAWSDAGCTTKIAMVYNDPTCPQPAPPYALDYTSTACTFSYSHLYNRGSQLGISQYYYQNSDGTCGGPYSAPSYSFYALGPEVVPAASLVKLTIGSPTTSGTLGERFVTSADGLSFPWTTHDALLGADCYAAAYDASGTSAVCLPDAGYAGYNHDSACTVPELSVSKTCTAPHYAEYFPQTACPSDPPKYFTVGSQVASSPLYYASGTQCTATTADTSSNYFTTAQTIQLSSLARAPDALVGHRIQLIHDTTPEGLRLRDYALYDSQLGGECYVIATPDGSSRCLTFGASISSGTFFKDAGCTQGIDLASVYIGPSACTAPPAPKYANKFVTPPPGSCTYSYEIHTVTGAYTAPVYVNNGSCVGYSQSANEVKLYSVGPAMDPSAFSLATAVTDQ
ncbi:MAG: hypothetical protein ACM31C_20320 [Acidobacteriota bacterium]